MKHIKALCIPKATIELYLIKALVGLGESCNFDVVFELQSVPAATNSHSPVFQRAVLRNNGGNYDISVKADHRRFS